LIARASRSAVHTLLAVRRTGKAALRRVAREIATARAIQTAAK